MHFSLSQTLAVVSQEPLSRVPNFPDDSAQTAAKTAEEKMSLLGFHGDHRGGGQGGGSPVFL